MQTNKASLGVLTTLCAVFMVGCQSPSSIALATAMPNAQTAVIDAGHVPHQSPPAELNRHVVAFLKTVVDEQ